MKTGTSVGRSSGSIHWAVRSPAVAITRIANAAARREVDLCVLRVKGCSGFGKACWAEGFESEAVARCGGWHCGALLVRLGRVRIRSYLEILMVPGRELPHSD